MHEPDVGASSPSSGPSPRSGASVRGSAPAVLRDALPGVPPAGLSTVRGDVRRQDRVRDSGGGGSGGRQDAAQVRLARSGLRLPGLRDVASLDQGGPVSRHPGIRNGRPGRPTREEEIEAGIRCECGVLVDKHPDIPKPGPLTSWKASKPRAPGFLSAGSSAGLGERGTPRDPRATAQAKATRSERQRAKAQEWQPWNNRTGWKSRHVGSAGTGSNGHREADGERGIG